MREFDAAAPAADARPEPALSSVEGPSRRACPICQSHIEDGALFCARCGIYLKGDGSSPEALNLPLVHLLAQVCTLQRELLQQFRTGQSQQARQFQRSLHLQSQQLEKTLDHAAHQSESWQRRLQIWQRWTIGLAAAVAALVVAAVQLAG